MKNNLLKTSVALLMFMLTFSVFSETAKAQEEKYSYGSIYSSFGVGLPYDLFNPGNMGTGTLGLTNTNTLSANLTNPALLGFYGYTSMSGGLDISNYSTDANGGGTSYSNIGFMPLTAVFPVFKGEFGFSLGVYPVTNMNFRNNAQSQVPGDTLNVNNRLVGEGGISAIELGFGYRINDDWSIGYAPAVLLGSIKRSSVVSVEGSRYRNTELTNINSHFGFSNKVGLYYQSTGVWDKNDRLRIGASATIPLTLTSTREEVTTIINTNGFAQTSTVDLGESEITLPSSFKLGAAYDFNPQWAITGDILYEPWSAYRNASGNAIDEYKDRFRVALGGSYAPDLTRTRFYLQGLSYKLGASYDSGAIRVSGNTIDALSVHAGINFPSSYNRSNVDVVFKYTRTGTTADNLIQENIYSVSFVFNLSELMFFERKIQ